MSKQCLDISQMQHLKELGVDTSKASCYTWYAEGKEYLYWGKCKDSNGTPVFTLQDILDLLPIKIEGCRLEFDKHKVSYFDYMNERTIKLKREQNLIDAAYEMLCWVIENGYLETNK